MQERAKGANGGGLGPVQIPNMDNGETTYGENAERHGHEVVGSQSRAARR